MRKLLECVLSTKAKLDKYGRFLAVLYDKPPTLISVARGLINPASINSKMITKGHAKERYW